ncbi:MAG: glycosyltransferase [Nitratireductor sp.]
MTGRPVILFYVQHLLGIGHVFRATRIARELVRHGALVHMVWGGTRLPKMNTDGLEMTWLDPVRVDGADFQNLVNADGLPVDDGMKYARRDTILKLFHDLRPDMVITEAYPFGRRQMRFELEPLMRAARSAEWKPVTVASIRDIMTENRAEKRVRESLDAANAWFDLILVHGDPALIRIEETLQGAEEVLHKVRYGGLVTPEPPDLAMAPSVSADVVVSAGGGAVGHALTAAAPLAMQYSATFPDNWLLIVGPERPQEDTNALAAIAPKGMRVERFVPDLARVLASAKVSVSRAGYNTTGDLMRAGTRCVLAPFAGGRETEQLRRAEILAEKGLASLLRDEDLTPQSLAAAVDRAATLPPMRAGFDLEGASHGAAILLEFLKNPENAGN